MLSKTLILASKSRVRAEVLRCAKVSFEVEVSDVDENFLKKKYTDSTEKLCSFLATSKACDISKKYPSRWVVGADQVCLFNGNALGKPKNIEKTIERLKTLRGKIHHLCCGIALAHEGKIQWKHQDKVTIVMHDFSDQFIQDYVERNKEIVISCTGGYALEGDGIQLISSLDGDFFSALGLPLLPLLKQMRERDLIAH